MLGKLDHDIILLLNSILGDDKLFNKMIVFFGEDPLFRGFPTFIPLVVLWFSGDFKKRRARLFTGLLATCLAVFLSVWLQHVISFHTRPFLDQTLAIKVFDPKVTEKFDYLGSFPSDSGTLYFALDTIISFEAPLVGVIAFLWSIITVGLVRVALGWHYISDVLGALLLGPGCVYLVSKSRHIGALSERFLALFRSHEPMLHALFFVFMAEAYHTFPSLQSIHGGLVMIVKRLMFK